jgi:hypothetical protein
MSLFKLRNTISGFITNVVSSTWLDATTITAMPTGATALGMIGVVSYCPIAATDGLANRL